MKTFSVHCRFADFFGLALCLALATATPPAVAQLSIDITRGNDEAISIAVVPFRVDIKRKKAALDNVYAIVNSNLVRSGNFKVLSTDDMLSYPSNLSEVYYRDWRLLGVQYLILGNITLAADRGFFSVHFQVLDVAQEKLLAKEEMTGQLRDIRSLAHEVSNVIYEHTTGVPGIFSTRLMYVSVDKTKRRPRYKIKLTNMDGKGTRVLHESREPLLSPAWSPTGREVAYASFEPGYSTVMLHDLAKKKSRRLVEHDVRTSAPAFSPDGSQLALTLVRRDNTDVYLYDLAKKKLSRVTTHYKIDTEPSWTPDGEFLTFTSNRSGSPQIFAIELASNEVRRLTFEGNYNAHSQVLPTGRHVAFVHRENGIFRVAIAGMDEPNMRLLASTAFAESPSISPNGVMLAYANQSDGRGELVVSSLSGDVRYRLPDAYGAEVREPAWSPFFSPPKELGR